MKINIKTKLFILMVGLTALILIGVLFVITMTLSQKIEQKIIADFNNTRTYFQKQQSLIFDRLAESCYLIGENSTFKANVELQDPATVYEAVSELARYSTVDLFTVTDERGMVLARFGQPAHYGDYITDRPSIVHALNGIEPEIEPEWAELWAVDSTLYQVATVPLYYNDFKMIGSISLGTLITQHEALDLKGKTNIDISMFLGNRCIASTLSDSLTKAEKDSFAVFLGRHAQIGDSVIQYLEPSKVFEGKLFNENVYAFLSPLGENEPAVYLATVPKALELSILKALQNNIFITALISLIITIILAFFLGDTFTNPILKLVGSMNRVKEGDLSVTLKSSTKDEIGLLTNTFNEMTIGLRERMHLMKYVGSHTIDMIKSASHESVSLGGDRKELAVLFSDIRGFTAFSENHLPEEVIKMLNQYLGHQASIVDQYKGSIDKFVGDEMVALFIGDDAVSRAVNCSIDIQKMVEKENAENLTPISVGIGINYGPVILGNMGATDRMDYTVIGAVVNLGARLCSAAKPGQILIRRDLLSMHSLNGFQTGDSQMMSFKGFSKEIEIVEVLSD